MVGEMRHNAALPEPGNNCSGSHQVINKRIANCFSMRVKSVCMYMSVERKGGKG